MSNDRELEEARREADEALAKAKEKRALGSRLAEGWRQSREDNNFRAMVRSLAGGGE